METAVAEGQFQTIRQIGHQIKGTAGNLRITPLADWATGLGKAAREADLEQCRAGLDELKELLS